MAKCILCGTNAVLNKQENASRTIYNCPGCGVFVISDVVQREVEENRNKIGAYLFRRNLTEHDDIFMISLERVPADKGYLHMTVEQIVAAFPDSFRRRMELTLENLIYKSEYPGYEIKIESLRNGPLLYLDHVNFTSMAYMITALEREDLIEINHYGTSSSFFPCGIVVTPAGWDLAENLTERTKNLSSAFIWVSGAADYAADYIDSVEKACSKSNIVFSSASDSGHDAYVNDRLAAEIKGSKYVICDLSDPLPAAYYVMGMASALGRPLVLTCQTQRKDSLQVNPEHISVIFWDDPAILTDRIHDAIRAKIV